MRLRCFCASRTSNLDFCFAKAAGFCFAKADLVHCFCASRTSNLADFCFAKAADFCFAKADFCFAKADLVVSVVAAEAGAAVAWPGGAQRVHGEKS